MGDVYRRSAVVVNAPIRGDVNMRFFEAMGSGTVDVNWAREHHVLWLEEAGAQDRAASAHAQGSAPAE